MSKLGSVLIVGLLSALPVAGLVAFGPAFAGMLKVQVNDADFA